MTSALCHESMAAARHENTVRCSFAFHPKRFVIREKYKYCSDLLQKPGELVQKLAIEYDRTHRLATSRPSRSRSAALLIKLIWYVGNESCTQGVASHPGRDLTYARAIQIVVEVEESQLVAKETVPQQHPHPIQAMHEHAGTQGLQDRQEERSSRNITCRLCS